MARILFLTADKVLDAHVPELFDRLPHLRTSVMLRDEVRQFCFHPAPRFAHPRDLGHLRPVGALRSAHGDRVEAFEQTEPPHTRMYVWTLSEGFVCFAANPEQFATVRQIVDNVRVSEESDGWPRVECSKLFSAPDLRVPKQREIAMFSGGSGEGPLHCLTFERLRSATSRDADTGTHGVLEQLVHYRGDVKVTLVGPRALRARLRDDFQTLIDTLEEPAA